MINSTEKAIYLLDANILIGFSIWNPIDIGHEFWSKLEGSLVSGNWILLDVVVNEIKYEGELKRWCREQQAKGRVRNITDNDRNRAIEINNLYKMIDDATQNSANDPYIIAYAEANRLTVVTREIHKENNNILWKIPDVCGKLNIPVIKSPKTFLKGIGF